VSQSLCACELWAPAFHVLLAALKGVFLLPDLEDAIRQFDVELAQFGPNLQQLIHKKGKVRPRGQHWLVWDSLPRSHRDVWLQHMLACHHWQLCW